MIAHVGGFPVEEGLLALAPAASAFAVMGGTASRTFRTRAFRTFGVLGRKHADGMSESSPSTIVSTTELTRVYGEGETAVHALRGVTTAFPSGQFAAIMGPSGSGKSTLMHLLAGLDRPTGGSVVVDGQELAHLDDKGLTRLRRDRLGFVFQAFNLVPVLTAEENIVLPLTLAGRKPDKEWHDTLIAAVGLGDRLTHRPSELSGGQQQRVAVARALIHRPAVVFADEPTGNLDSSSSDEVLKLLRQAVDDFGQTVVMVTHDAHAASVADRIVVLSDGGIVHDGAGESTEGVLDLMKAVA
jgi:putative ABC transport system ATP-binding protein